MLLFGRDERLQLVPDRTYSQAVYLVCTYCQHKVAINPTLWLTCKHTFAVDPLWQGCALFSGAARNTTCPWAAKQFGTVPSVHCIKAECRVVIMLHLTWNGIQQAHLSLVLPETKLICICLAWQRGIWRGQRVTCLWKSANPLGLID